MQSIVLLKLDNSGMWIMPKEYKTDEIIHLYLNGEEIFKNVDYIVVSNNIVDILHANEYSFVSADIRG